MASPPVTFPCPFCTRRMGVPAELLGRQVRCPHCKQVVVAPVTAGPAPAVAPQPPPPPPEPAPAPVAVAPAPAPEPELRPFNIPQKAEGADSILSGPNESDDEVFGSNPDNRLSALSREPAPPAPQPTAPPNNPFSFGSAPPAPVGGDLVPSVLTGSVFALPGAAAPAPVQVPPSVTKQELLDPFDDLGPPAPPAPQPLPKPVAAIPQPTAVPRPVPAPAPIPAPVPAPPRQTAPLPTPVAPAPVPANSNPFAVFDAPPEPVRAKAPKSKPATDDIPEEVDESPKKKKKKKDEDAEPEEKPARGEYGRAASSGGSGKTILLVLLAGYAFVVTLVAIYGLFFGSGTPAGHPLSNIPDNFGEFDPVSRKKVSRATFPVDGPLPPEQRVTLDGKITIGQVEVTPKKIEKRVLVIEMEDTSGKDKRKSPTRDKALVLTLDIKNTSPDLPIFPMDPAFLRREGKDDQPITRLVTSKRSYFGGEIKWPLAKIVKKEIEVQQANDSIELKPGESREYVVFTAASAELVRTVEADQGPLQWRVQIRRGLTAYKGKEIPVTAIIGVDFKAADIRQLE